MSLAEHGCPLTDGSSHPHRKRCQVTTELMLSYLVPVFPCGLDFGSCLSSDYADVGFIRWW